MTRTEHLQWAKDRALEHLAPRKTDVLGKLAQRIRHAVVPLAQAEQVIDAWESLVSDLGKHPETQAHPDIMPGSLRLLGGHLRTVGTMRSFIESLE